MNNLGKRIKELRKKNDLTQEKLADFLGVTYKAVSKWECGLTTPDISLIVPMARLFNVTTDEILGMQSSEVDERKRYFDAEYFEFWNKDDHQADYKIALEAVAEYPNEYKYLHWLGSVEYYIAFDFEPQDEFISMMDSSIKHLLMVYENCPDQNLAYDSLWTIICAYRYSDRIEEATKYAMLYPEAVSPTRDDALEMCLQGEDLLIHQQKMIASVLNQFCKVMHNLYFMVDINDPRANFAVTATQKLLEAIFPDDNTLEYSYWFREIHKRLADIALTNNDYDLAVTELRKAMKYTAKGDLAMKSGKQFYTTPILDHYEYDRSDSRPLEESYTEYLKNKLSTEQQYGVIRDREDFQALLK